MAMMEKLQTQNDTALPQWVSWNKSFSVTGRFGSPQIKLSYSRNWSSANGQIYLGPNGTITLFFFYFFFFHFWFFFLLWFVETFQGIKSQSGHSIIDILMILLEWNEDITDIERPCILFKWLRFKFSVTCYCNSTNWSPHTLAMTGLWSLIPNFMLCFCTKTLADA